MFMRRTFVTFLLGGHEDLLARNAAVLDCAADAAFVPIDLRSVDVTVANFEGMKTRLVRLVTVFSLIDAQADGGDGVPAVEGDCNAACGTGHFIAGIRR